MPLSIPLGPNIFHLLIYTVNPAVSFCLQSIPGRNDSFVFPIFFGNRTDESIKKNRLANFAI